jgi:glucose-1-phosphate thymidylyltransferase
LDRVLQAVDPSRLVVVTNSRFAESFREWAFKTAAPVPIEVIDDGTESNETRLGAVGDMALAVEFLGSSEEPILVVGGDNLIDFDLGPHLARFDPDAGPLLFVRTIEGPVPPGRYSEICLDENDRVISCREKPDDPKSPLSANLGEDLAAFRAQSPELDAPGWFLVWLASRKNLFASRIPGPYYDIGNLETLSAARSAFAGRKPTQS